MTDMATEIFGNLDNNCCVCFSKGLHLLKVTNAKNLEHKAWITKLRNCVKDIEWSENYVICEECSQRLDTVYDFHHLCFKTEQTRRKGQDVQAKSCIKSENGEEVEVKYNCLVDIITSSPDLGSIGLHKSSRGGTTGSDDEFIDNGDSDFGDNTVEDDRDSYNEDDDDDSADSDWGTNTRKTRSKTKPRPSPKVITRANNKNDTSTFTCDICSSFFNTSKEFVVHSVSEHNIDKNDVKPFRCTQCPSRFKNLSFLNNHVKYHDGVRDQICNYCGKGFVMKIDLQIHEKTHLNKREHPCDECGKRFNTYKDVRTHKICVHTDHSLWKYECEYCSKKFPMKSAYDNHIRTHTKERPFECNICGKKFSDKRILTKHLKSKIVHAEHKCSECGLEFGNKKQLKTHVTTVHPNVKPERRSRKSKKDSEFVFPQVCKFCSVECPNVSDLFEHYKNVHPDKDVDDIASALIENDFGEPRAKRKANQDPVGYNPKQLKKEVTSDEEMASDDNDSDYAEEPATEPVKKPLKQSKPKSTFVRVKRIDGFSCETCQQPFPSSTKLIDHAVKEHQMDKKSVKAFTCPRCGHRFHTSANLYQHLKYHDGIRNEICSYCGKGFITKIDLQIHEKIHLNLREYKCDTCGKGFNTHKDLRSHRICVHTDPILWKYMCSVCGKRFPFKSNYDNHMRSHNNDKPFGCHLCEKKFSDRSTLRKHIRSHSNIREFKCVVCGREYKDKRVMEIHMARIHNYGEYKAPEKVKKFFCHLCPKSYYAKDKLTRHIYSHTGERPFACTVCDKKFSDKSYVKQHMKTTHNFIPETIT